MQGRFKAMGWACVLCAVGCFGGGNEGNAGAGGAQGDGSAGVSGNAGTNGLPGMPAGGATAMTGGTGAAGAAAGTGAASAGMAGMDAAGAGGTGTAGTAGTSGGGGSGGDDPACDLACDQGTHCELVAVQCIKAPCPPVPECVEDPHCGGFAGFPCPGMGSCEDDPRDDCDPKNGGADCGGLCGCVGDAICPAEQKWDSSPMVCACVPVSADSDETRCGKTTCAKGMVCCNASCGICTPPDGACIEIACL